MKSEIKINNKCTVIVCVKQTKKEIIGGIKLLYKIKISNY